MAPPLQAMRGSLLCAVLLLLGPAHGQMMIKYVVTNDVAGTPDGDIFDKEFGVMVTQQLMENATRKVWKVLNIIYPITTNPYTEVTLSITTGLGPAIARAGGNLIQFDMGKMGAMTWGLRRDWFISVMYHEMTHVWQRFPPRGLYNAEVKGIREGTADYTTMVASVWSPDCIGWKAGPKDYWSKGYCTTAHFFRFLNNRSSSFVADLNSRVSHHGYKEQDFIDLLSKTPDVLWREFLKSPFAALVRAGGNVPDPI